MINQHLIREPIFAFYFNKTGGELTFGGVNHERYTGDFKFIESDNRFSLWAFILEKIKIGSQSFCTEGCLAILDSGTTMISGSTKLITAINNYIDPFHIGQYKWKKYLVACQNINMLLDIKFLIQGKEFTMTPEDYVIKDTTGSAEYCYTGFFINTYFDDPKWKNKPFVLTGTIFMRKYYTQFDWKSRRIGFALAKHGRLATDKEE